MIKVIFFDVDGTLYSHNLNKVPESTVKSLNKLRENGIKLIISTGRHISTLNKLDLSGLKFDGFITSNGQMCHDEEQNFLQGNAFDKTSLEFVLSIFKKKEMSIILIDQDRIYLNYVNDHVSNLYASYSVEMPPVDEYRGGDIYQASVYIPIEEEHLFTKDMPNTCKLARWSDLGADIITSDGGKSYGVKYFLNRLGLKRDEAMAFGDAQNDIEMFSSVGTSVAMGNGIEALKEIASFVTKDIDDDGIEFALKNFNLI